MVITTAPPKVLSMEEYRQDWQPAGWQLIIIGPTSTWRQEWGEWEAIRDIVQNALDEAEAYRWGYDEQGLWISDRGRGIAVADLLLGPPKLKADYARGKFGEGMKIATLALIRKGYPVYVETVGRELWVIFLKQTVDETAETLAAMWRPNGSIKGTKFHIIGYTGPAFDDRFTVNLPRSAIIWETPSMVTKPVKRYNQLIKYDFVPIEKGFPEATRALGLPFTKQSRIYARDIYMRESDSPYSYNLWGFDMAPDRHGPKNEADMWVDMGRLWCGVTRVELLEDFLKMVRQPPLIEATESHNISMDSWSMGTEPMSGNFYADFVKDNASYWQRAWRNVFGVNAVIRTSDRWDGTVKHLGYVPISVQWSVQNTLSQAITTDADLVKVSQARLRDVEVIPDGRLTPRQLAHLKLARAIADKFRWPRVGGVYAAIIPPASDRVRTAGLYGRVTQEIFIASDQLESAERTVDTVIHELAHHLSGAEDLEPSHSEWMTNVAARVVFLTSRREFDELLKEVTW